MELPIVGCPYNELVICKDSNIYDCLPAGSVISAGFFYKYDCYQNLDCRALHLKVGSVTIFLQF